VRLGGFPSASPEARLAAARASANHYGAEQTARLWVQAADALEGAGREREAVDPLMQAATLEPEDMALRRRVALACATTGQLDRVRAFLSFETAADHPDLLLALAEYALAEARDNDARIALQRVIAVAPERRTEAEAMLAPLMAASVPETTASEPEHPAASEPEPEPAPNASPTDFFAVSVEASTDDEPLDVAAAFGVGSEGESTVDEPVLLDTGAAENALEPEPVPEPQPESGPKTGGDGALEEEFVAEAAREPLVEIAQEPVPSASRADLDSITALRAAAQNPALQFQASAQLGRLLLRLGRVGDGIEWLDKASRAATPVREQRLGVMYELADALERAGEHARALDVFADLDFDAASYRDVPERMAALRRGLGEGSVR
jgi:tetratricopeptide (TPR) repeat protein